MGKCWLSIRGNDFIADWAYAKCLKVEYLGRIKYDFQKSCVTGPWDHKDSVSAKKSPKISCLCTYFNPFIFIKNKRRVIPSESFSTLKKRRDMSSEGCECLGNQVFGWKPKKCAKRLGFLSNKSSVNTRLVRVSTFKYLILRDKN